MHPHVPPTGSRRPPDAAGGPHRDAVDTLTRWRPPDHGQDSLRHGFLAFLAAREDGCRRSCEPGHLTASTILLDADGEHALLTLHPRVGLWLQLGGHCEDGDATLAAAALREATEESGIEGVRVDPRPLHLAVHPITCSLGLPTRHLDVRFVGVAPPGARPCRTAESLDLRWWRLADVTAPDVAPDVVIMAGLATERLGQLGRPRTGLTWPGSRGG